MLLSIGMIVKNEEKYLEQCLTALKPILENVDSELIIADTGSTDNTVEIAKKFTDKVFYFEWINDFSAARNFTMEKSVGEWFMFLDADEIFRSCDDIIRFFNSGEYRLYGNAMYTIRSYDDTGLSEYLDIFAMRLAKRYPDVAFKNKIHEALYPLHKPIKQLDVIADHYGYIYRDNGNITEQAYIKTERNLTLLLKSLEEPVVDFNAYKEIADCYRIVDDIENTLKYLNMGLEKLDHRHVAITQYYSEKANFLVNEKRYEEAIDACNDYFGSDNLSRTTVLVSDIDMHAMRGEAYYRTNNFDKAADDLVQLFKVYNAYKIGRLKTEDMLFNPIRIKDVHIKNAYLMLFYSCQKTRKYNVAADVMKGFPIEKYQGDKAYMLTHSRNLIEIMENTNYKGMKKYFNRLDDENRQRFIRMFRWHVFYTKKIEEVLSVLFGIAGKNTALFDIVKLYNSFFISSDLEYEQIEDFINTYGTYHNVDILCMMLKCGMDISCYLTASDFNAKECAVELYAGFKNYIVCLEQYDINKMSSECLTEAASLYGWAMVEAYNSGKSIIQLFESFGSIAIRWQSNLLSAETIPGDIGAGLIVHSITEARKNKDFSTCISEMRKLIKEFPDFAPFVSEYRKIIEQEISSPKDAKSELSEMAEMVKRNIRTMLDAGDISSAEKTLLELEKLCPSDAEIGMLKYHIKTLKMR